MTVQEFYEQRTPYSQDKEQELLQYYDYLSVEYDNYLRVAKHRDGRYFVVDYNGDIGVDDTDQDLHKIVAEWYSKAH
jgi:thymidylate kinase